MVKSYSSKSTYSEDHILVPKGCCTLKLLHALKNDQVYLAHTPPGMGVTLTIFFKERSQIGLKFSVLGARSLDTGGVVL